MIGRYFRAYLLKVFNGVLYILKEGTQKSILKFGFRRTNQLGTLLYDHLLIVDVQSIKNMDTAESKGYDMAKKPVASNDPSHGLRNIGDFIKTSREKLNPVNIVVFTFIRLRLVRPWKASCIIKKLNFIYVNLMVF